MKPHLQELSSGSKSDCTLQNWIGEYQSTVPSGDTVSLRSPSKETQLENLGGDTEVLDILDYYKDVAPQEVDDYEEEVVLDSDDERLHKTEMVNIKQLSSDELQRTGVDVLGNSCVHNTDFVVGSAASAHNQCRVGQFLEVSFEHDTAKLCYNESEESGESSEANALVVVANYLSLNHMNLSEEGAATKASRQKSPPVLCAKGPQILARRTTFGSMSGTFEWDDNQIGDGEGDFLIKRKGLILNSEGPDAISVPNMNAQRQRNLDVQCKEKLKGKMMGADFPNPSLIVDNYSKEIGEVVQVSETRFVKGIDDQLDEETSGQQYEAVGFGRDASDMFDVGFDTQMAAEAMEALFCGPSPKPNIDYAHQDPGEIQECSFSTRVCSNSFPNSVVTARKLKQINRHIKKLSGKKVSSFPQNKESHKKLDPDLPESKKGNRGKSLAQNHFNCEKLTDAKKRSCASLFKLNEQGKEDKVLERDIIKEVSKNLVSSTSMKHSSVGEVPLQGKRRKYSQNADTLQASSVRGKRSKIGLHISEEATDVKMSQKARKELDVSQAGSNLKLDIWNYPRRKRKSRNFPCHSKEGEKGIGYSIGSHQKSQGNSQSSLFCLDVRRKPRSSAYARQVRSSLVKKCEESFLRQNSDEQSSPDVPCGANKEVKLEILSNGNDAKASLPKFPSTANFTRGLDLAPAIHESDNDCKQLCNKKPSRFPLMKELISLRFSGSFPNITLTDLRRRRDMAHVCVLFSQNLGGDIIKQQKKILARLGCSVASCCSDATHFIADRFVRTRNMLEAIALGKPVVTRLWLESCGQASYFIDEKNYILRDAKKEKEIGFSMPVSLAHARQHPLLKGHRVFITPNIKPGKELITSLVKAVDGQAVDRIQEAAMENEMVPDDILILSCEQDHALCAPFLHRGATVYSSELLLNGIIIQKLEFERLALQQNHSIYHLFV
ncbi:hypothetical protein U1Q18_020104 [Sarracenia purpurea var. burkii]